MLFSKYVQAMTCYHCLSNDPLHAVRVGDNWELVCALCDLFDLQLDPDPTPPSPRPLFTGEWVCCLALTNYFTPAPGLARIPAFQKFFWFRAWLHRYPQKYWF